ncbi:MAG TPA: hypothetical protein VMH36_21510 [Alphaproteobacteria bacterium]|nr:hypothetical protein [Alphaproteobacteria bacterium]
MRSSPFAVRARRRIAALAACAVLVPLAAAAQDASCRLSARRVGACFTVHGRLSFTATSPEIRIWRVGTHHVLGILAPDGSDQQVLSEKLLERLWSGRDLPGQIWGDYEVCPLSPDQPGKMQMACIADATKLFVERPHKDPAQAAVPSTP